MKNVLKIVVVCIKYSLLREVYDLERHYVCQLLWTYGLQSFREW